MSTPYWLIEDPTRRARAWLNDAAERGIVEASTGTVCCPVAAEATAMLMQTHQKGAPLPPIMCPNGCPVLSSAEIERAHGLEMLPYITEAFMARVGVG